MARLESTALHLEARGDLRNVVRFVEKWAEVGDPTPKARLAQARAFLGLKMMDRAWIRLNELSEAGNGGVEALVLTGRLFVERGWPSRARRPLELALLETSESRKEDVRAWLARADQPPLAPPDDPSDGESDPAVFLAAAERHMALGAFLKAQSLLERAKRAAPDHPRADDLLWAMKGEYGTTDTLAELADRWGPDLSALADVTEEPEHTESLDRETSIDDAEPAESPAEAAPGAFPSLFRRPEPEEPSRTEDRETTDDVTQTSAMAELRAIAVPNVAESGGDTQIVRVIHSDKGAEISSSTGPMHEPSNAPSGTFDLAAWRREMGMADMASDADFGGALEEEDDSRIMLTHREKAPDPERKEEPTGAGLETIEPDTTSEIRADMAKQVRLHEAPTLIDSSEAPTRARSGEKKRSRRPKDPAPWWLLVVGLGLLLTATVLLLALLFQIAQQLP